jgi:hypothetical protein
MIEASTNGVTAVPVAATTKELRQEYVAGGARIVAQRAIQVLRQLVDDLELELGADTYEKMLRDSKVASSYNGLKVAMLEDGIHLVASDADTDGLVAAFCTRCLINLTPTLADTLWDLCDAMAYGHRVAEQVYADGAGDDAGRLVLAKLKVKPRKTTAFVVDSYLNVIGLLGQKPGGAAPSSSVALVSPQEAGVLPRAKFAILTHRPKDADPRGTSILRAAYTAWHLKVNLWPEYFKFLIQCAVPSLVGVVSERAQPVPELDEAGHPTGHTLTAEQALLESLLAFQGGTAGAFPWGTEINPLELGGASANAVFEAGVQLLNSEIAQAIELQTLASGEGKHQTRASTQEHKDIRDTLVRQLKGMVSEMLRRDVLTPLVVLNFGPAAAASVPTITLGQVAQEDRSGLMAAVAALNRSGYFDPSQYPAIDALLGLPARTPDEVQQRTDRAAAPPPAPVIPGTQPGTQPDDPEETP